MTRLEELEEMEISIKTEKSLLFDENKYVLAKSIRMEELIKGLKDINYRGSVLESIFMDLKKEYPDHITISPPSKSKITKSEEDNLLFSEEEWDKNGSTETPLFKIKGIYHVFNYRDIAEGKFVGSSIPECQYRLYKIDSAISKLKEYISSTIKNQHKYAEMEMIGDELIGNFEVKFPNILTIEKTLRWNWNKRTKFKTLHANIIIKFNNTNMVEIMYWGNKSWSIHRVVENKKKVVTEEEKITKLASYAD